MSDRPEVFVPRYTLRQRVWVAICTFLALVSAYGAGYGAGAWDMQKVCVSAMSR